MQITTIPAVAESDMKTKEEQETNSESERPAEMTDQATEKDFNLLISIVHSLDLKTKEKIEYDDIVCYNKIYRKIVAWNCLCVIKIASFSVKVIGLHVFVCISYFHAFSRRNPILKTQGEYDHGYL